MIPDEPIDYSESLQVVSAINFDIGEGPIWDMSANRLICVDCNYGHIYLLDLDTGKFTLKEIDQTIGIALPCENGGLVVTSGDGLLYCNKEGEVSLVVPIEADLKANRMNDGKCDSRGRLWTGTFSKDFKRDAGSLYRIDPDLSVRKMLGDIRVSNGIAWNKNETLMYFNDTLSGGVDVFDYDVNYGTLSNRRRFVDIKREEGLPDGLTVDVEGCVWVALFYGGEVRRYNTEGILVGVVKLPVSRVTSCNFGGKNLTDLFITTADFKIDDDGRPHEPEAGYVFKCQPGVQGLRSYPFGKK